MIARLVENPVVALRIYGKEWVATILDAVERRSATAPAWARWSLWLGAALAILRLHRQGAPIWVGGP